MADPKRACGRCGKNVFPMDEIKAANKVWHKPGSGKDCFRCKTCNIALTLAAHKAEKGEIYCNAHVPQRKVTTVKDSVAMKTALNAPKKVSEGTGVAQKGDGKLNAAKAANAPAVTAKTSEPMAAGATAKAAAPAADAPAPAADAPAPAADAPAPADAPPADAPAATEAPPADAPPADAPPADAPPADAPAADAPAADAPPAPQ